MGKKESNRLLQIAGSSVVFLLNIFLTIPWFLVAVLLSGLACMSLYTEGCATEVHTIFSALVGLAVLISGMYVNHFVIKNNLVSAAKLDSKTSLFLTWVFAPLALLVVLLFMYAV